MLDSIYNMNILADYSIDMNYNIAKLPIYVNEESMSDYPDKKTASHWNDGLEIIYITKGNMFIIVNGRKYFVSAGDICIINSRCVHYFSCEDASDCRYHCFIIEESIFITNNEINKKYINPLFHPANPEISIINQTQVCNPTLSSILLRIVYYAKEKQAAYEIYIISLFNIFIAALYESHPMSFNANANHDAVLDISMKNMLQYIYDNYSDSISSYDLCLAGQISRNQCFSLFKKYTGDTPALFILKYRLAIARNQLSNTNTPIAQIAINCGFTHQSHLTCHFTKYYGITPLQYRKNHFTT